jgi:hypothetical protein
VDALSARQAVPPARRGEDPILGYERLQHIVQKQPEVSIGHEPETEHRPQRVLLESVHLTQILENLVREPNIVRDLISFYHHRVFLSTIRSLASPCRAEPSPAEPRQAMPRLALPGLELDTNTLLACVQNDRYPTFL